MRGAPTACALLLVGAVHNQAHKLVAVEDAAMVWNLTGASLIAVLLTIVAWQHRTAAVLLVCALLGGWALQTAFCSAMWLYEPWELVEGGELCSDRLGLPLGMFGLAVVCLVAAHIGRRDE